MLAADLGDGTDDPRATAPDLLRRALAALPPRARASGRVAMRADAGYFAGQLARAAHDANIASRSAPSGSRRCGGCWPASPRRTGTTPSTWTAPRSRSRSTARTGGPRTPGC